MKLRVEFTLQAGRVYYVEYPAQRMVVAAKAMEDLKDCDMAQLKAAGANL